MKHQYDTEFWRNASTALCLIRDGLHTSVDIQAALRLPALAMADLLEGLTEQKLIVCFGQWVEITAAGRSSVRHIQLVEDVSNPVFGRWTISNPDGRKRAA